MKSISIFLLAITFFISLAGSCFADNEIVKKQYQFFGENDEFLAEVVGTGVKTRLVPKIPDGITKDDAIKVWQGEKINPKKSCDQIFTGFTDGIHAIKNCTEISMELSPTEKNPLNIVVKKTLTTENSAIIFWPILGIMEIFALAIFFIARGAPAKFMAQCAGIIIASMAITLTINSMFLLNTKDKTTIEIIITIITIIILYLDNSLVSHWYEEYPALKGITSGLIILQILGTILIPTIFIVSFASINSTSVGVDFICFIGIWFILATIIIAVANSFPNFRKKYLSWV